jgi:hypothetical protein
VFDMGSVTLPRVPAGRADVEWIGSGAGVGHVVSSRARRSRRWAFSASRRPFSRARRSTLSRAFVSESAAGSRRVVGGLPRVVGGGFSRAVCSTTVVCSSLVVSSLEPTTNNDVVSKDRARQGPVFGELCDLCEVSFASLATLASGCVMTLATFAGSSGELCGGPIESVSPCPRELATVTSPANRRAGRARFHALRESPHALAASACVVAQGPDAARS